MGRSQNRNSIRVLRTTAAAKYLRLSMGDGAFQDAGSMTRGSASIRIYRLFQKIW